MTLTLGDCAQQIEHALGGRLDHRLSARQLVNEVGEHFMSHHRWRWAKARSAKLDFKAPVSGTTATCDTAGTTLTSGTGDFTDYTFGFDDNITITSGSANIPIPNDGRISKILSKTSNTVLVLETKINDDAVAGTAIGWKIEFDYFTLPTDFGKVVSIQASDALTRGFRESTFGTLQALRSDPVETSTWFYWGVISHRLSPGEVKPIFEIWPTPSTEELQWITLWYEAVWPRLSSDNDKLTLPTYCEQLYLQMLREAALGYEEGENGSVDERLTKLQLGGLARAAYTRDGGIQQSIGPIQNGAQSMVMRPSANKFTRTPVQPPS